MRVRDHRGNRRQGAAIVEFAVVAPVLFLLVLGLVEFTRVEMAYQAITTAAQEGCRAGVVPASTSADVMVHTNQALSGGYVSGASVTITPAEVATLKQGQPLSVSIQVPFRNVSWLPSPMFLGARVLKTRCIMLREAK